MNSAVIGLGFGDEGKGTTVNYLSDQNPKPLIIRYSGIPAAGHNVIHNGIQHVFSTFGSGTLNGCSTYIDQFCTIDIIALLNEYDSLVSKGISPKIYINAKCPIITPYDKIFNIKHDSNHGTTGRGISATIHREEQLYSLLYEDLEYKYVLDQKLNQIKKYYSKQHVYAFSDLLDPFFECVNDIKNYESNIIMVRSIDDVYMYDSKISKDKIYESSQGLMLDQNIGFFPHVTRNKVDMTNISRNINQLYLITRAYSTRHGKGPFDAHNIILKNTECEINVDNTHQGPLRLGYLNLDLINYAINKTDRIRNTTNKHLVITCMDQLTEFKYIFKNEIHEVNTMTAFINDIHAIVRPYSIITNDSPEGNFKELFCKFK